jgi:hypothetical protein
MFSGRTIMGYGIQHLGIWDSEKVVFAPKVPIPPKEFRTAPFWVLAEAFFW